MNRFKSSTHALLVRKVLNLLPERTIYILILLTGFQIFATFLDIFAILLLGYLTKIGIEVIKGASSNISIPYFNFTFFESMEQEQQFALLSGVVVVLFALRTFLALWGNRKILLFLGVRSSQASNEILRRLFESKPQYVVSKRTQELLYGVTSGVDNLVLSYFGSLVILISESIFLFAVIGSLLIVQPIPGLCSLLIFGGMGLLIHKLTSTASREDSARSSNISVSYSQQLLEALYLYREHYLRGSILDSTSEVQKLRKDFLEIRANLMFLPILAKYLFEFVLILGGAMVAAFQFLITDAAGAIASVVIFIGASSRILPSVVRMQGSLLLLKQSEGASQITLRQIDEFEVNKNTTSAFNLHEIDTSATANFIEVRDLHFRYADEENDTLKNLDFSIERGQLVAIVGESGAGKSTLADLLLGIQEPYKGTITINGTSPRNYVKNKPGALGYVPQDITILDGTIFENVSLSKNQNLDRSQAISSLNKASLLQETRLSKVGVDTFVGERGIKLSGGQRQRLGIARALFTNPELIVFDEATSSLDPRTEKVVTEAIYRNHGQVTLIVIAHRLSTVKKADLVLLLDQGSLVASGTFEEVRAIAPKFDEQAKLANL